MSYHAESFLRISKYEPVSVVGVVVNVSCESLCTQVALPVVVSVAPWHPDFFLLRNNIFSGVSKFEITDGTNYRLRGTLQAVQCIFEDAMLSNYVRGL